MHLNSGVYVYRLDVRTGKPLQRVHLTADTHVKGEVKGAVLPDILIRYFNVPFYFGGTGLLIVVGVTLDTLQQIESHLLMRNYDGFMKRGKLRGRR